MKLILALTVILFIAKTGYGMPICQDAITEFLFTHLICAENAMEIQKLIGSYSKNRTTYEEIESNISEMCNTAQSTQCYNDLATPISEPCNEIPKLQHFRNALRVVLTFNEFMCQNNGTQFLDFIKDGGASCYLHSNKTNCFKSAKIEKNISGEFYFKDESICLILEADLSCHNHYEECINTNVKTDYMIILTMLIEKFHCKK